VAAYYVAPLKSSGWTAGDRTRWRAGHASQKPHLVVHAECAIAALFRQLEAAGFPHNDISIIASMQKNGTTTERIPIPTAISTEGTIVLRLPARVLLWVRRSAGGWALGWAWLNGYSRCRSGGCSWLAGFDTGRAAAGGATGGAIGALTQAGISDDDAHVYAEGLRRGGAVVSARGAEKDANRLQAIIDRSAVRISDRAAVYRKSGE
jgi:hypothetical protein